MVHLSDWSLFEVGITATCTCSESRGSKSEWHYLGTCRYPSQGSTTHGVQNSMIFSSFQSDTVFGLLDHFIEIPSDIRSTPQSTRIGSPLRHHFQRHRQQQQQQTCLPDTRLCSSASTTLHKAGLYGMWATWNGVCTSSFRMIDFLKRTSFKLNTHTDIQTHTCTHTRDLITQSFPVRGGLFIFA